MAAAAVRPLTQRADFERVLTVPARSRSAHFAVHHMSSRPLPARKPSDRVTEGDLSTGAAPILSGIVDNSPQPDQRWLGCVVPKRHARRAVTRSLLKRQIRSAMARHAARLAPGIWLVRLKAPYPRAEFASAASDALRLAARAELEQLFDRAAA